MFGILPRHVLFYSYDVDGVLSILYTGFTQPAALARSVAHWPVELEVAALIPDQGCQRCCGGGHCLYASSSSTEFKGPIKRHGIEQFLFRISFEESFHVTYSAPHKPNSFEFSSDSSLETSPGG